MATSSPIAFYAVGALCGLLCLRIAFKYLRQQHALEKTSDSATSTVENNNSKDHPVTVIVPALNEDAVLIQTIERIFTSYSLRASTAPTVIVVTAGSSFSDNAEIQHLRARNATLLFKPYPGPPSRGGQQNYGAHLATSPILLFLHADTLLPKSWDVAILFTLTKRAAPAIGAFSLSLPDPVLLPLRIMLWGANIRARYGGLPYGDQAYFLLRSTFESIGGFPDVPIMEDVSLLRRIKQYGKGTLTILEEQVQTSPRRWVKNGMIWNTILNQLLMTAWICGASPSRIYVWYYGQAPEKMVKKADDKREGDAYHPLKTK